MARDGKPKKARADREREKLSPCVSTTVKCAHTAPAAAMAAYSQNVPEPPNAPVSRRNVCATAAFVSQFAVADTPLAKPRTCKEHAYVKVDVITILKTRVRLIGLVAA